MTKKSYEKGINNHLTTKSRQSWITSVCFGIAKLMFKLNIIGYCFSLSYMPMHDMLKRKKICKEELKKKNQNSFKYGSKCVSRRCGSYRMFFEGDSPHQVVMIVWELNWFSHISNCHNMRHLCNLVMFFSHTTRKIICYFWYMYRYNVIWPSQGIHVLLYAR